MSEKSVLTERFGLIDGAIDYALKAGLFSDALSIAEKHATERIPEVHLQHAMRLEDEGTFHEAEEHFIQAGT